VAYTPGWKRLAKALKRILATSTEDEAKPDVCRGKNNQKIDVAAQFVRSVSLLANNG
jgi:hypothetical protein